MNNSRPRSSSRVSSSEKPLLRTKFKQRTGATGIVNEANMSMDQIRSKGSKFSKTKDHSKMFLQRTFKNKFPLD